MDDKFSFDATFEKQIVIHSIINYTTHSDNDSHYHAKRVECQKQKNRTKGEVNMNNNHIQKIMIALLVFVMSILLVACTNNSLNNKDSEQEESIAPEDTDQEQSSTRMYVDAMGRNVELPALPERIIAHYYASELHAINQPIIGTNFVNASSVLSEEQLKGIEDIGGEGMAPNLEKTLALNPDLIIVPNFMEQSDLEALSKIAPTVVLDYSSDVFSRLRAIGEIIGKPENAEKWIADYTAKAEEKRKEVESLIMPGETASAFIIYHGKELYVYGPQRLGPIMYDVLGFTMPQKVEEMFKDKKDSLWEMISLEALPEFAGDRIFLVASDDSEETKQMIEEVMNEPVWRGLPAVKSGKAHVVDSKWAFNDPLTLDWLLDEMTKTVTQ